MSTANSGFSPISNTLQEVLTEVLRRPELQTRLEAEMARRLNDKEFLSIAEQSGVVI